MSNVTRPSSSNNYDERFVVPLEASRRGAHRARVSPVMAALPIVAVAGIVLGAIFLVYTLFGGLSGSEAGADATSSVSPTSTPSASEAAPSSTPSEGEESPSESPTGSAAAGEVDKTLTVDLYNGTRPLVSGLARKATPKITNAGWATGKVETWTGSPVTATTVYYGAADQRATAQALAKALGRATVKLSPSKAGGADRIAVVIGNDFLGGATRSTTKNPQNSSSSTRSSTSRTSSGATTKSSASSTSDTATETGDPGGESPSPTN